MFSLSDHLGSVIAQTDDKGVVFSRAEHTPFGETSFGDRVGNRFRFTGRERDDESGLVYHDARYYAPWLARWASVDPKIVDGPNAYVYSLNRPTVFTDVTGRQAEHTTHPPDAMIATRSDEVAGQCTMPPYSPYPSAWGPAGGAFDQWISLTFDPHYYKSIAGAPEHMNSLAEKGVISPNGVKVDLAAGQGEEFMTARHLQGQPTINKLGTDRTSWTKDVTQALGGAANDRNSVVTVDPRDVKAAGGQFKQHAEVMADAAKVAETGRNSAERRQGTYGMKKAAQYVEGHMVGPSPEGTVGRIGFLAGRGEMLATAGGAAMLGAGSIVTVDNFQRMSPPQRANAAINMTLLAPVFIVLAIAHPLVAAALFLLSL
jgi:RHS repeat-associated protein